VLAGDPSKAGPFTLRVKVPADYKIPPHTHPAIEHVTVLEGSLQMGLGEKWDEAVMKSLPVGGFAVMDIGTKHFAGSKEGCTIQLHGIGPWDIHYLNPDDDPRKQRESD
jgi:anti-sigma factor ChrR (cupin superfamily)